MFALHDNDKIVGVMTSNVDDLLYGSLEGYEDSMKKILETFSVREINDAPFRFCGKEIVQYEDMSIKVTAKDNTDKIRPIIIGDKRKAADKCTEAETTCLRSVVAAIAWVARQVRPGLSYRVSKHPWQEKGASKTFVIATSCSNMHSHVQTKVYSSALKALTGMMQSYVVSATLHFATRRSLSTVCLKMEEVSRAMFVV